MKTITTHALFVHQGVKLHPKLTYDVPDEVADGLVSLGAAQYAADGVEWDVSYAKLTWDPATVRAADSGVIVPAPIVSQT